MTTAQNTVPFTHLHLHTPYSLLDGFCRIDDLISLAKEYGMKHVGISDHGVCHGHVEFYKKAKEAGLKPILGFEAYVSPNRFLKKAEYDASPEFWDKHQKMNHLLLIARTNEGYQNLLKLSSVGFLEGFYYKPRIDYEMLQTYGKGIIATSACLGSDISQYIMAGNYEMAQGMIRFYEQCFDEFYLEIQPGDADQELVNEVLIRWSQEMNIPLVATSDAHMLKKEEKPIHAALTVIGKSEDDSDISVYEHCYFMSSEEMLSFGMPEEALINAYNIAEKCDVEIELGNVKYPEFDVPDEHDFDTYLEYLCAVALFEYAMEKEIDIEAYDERLKYELGVIKDKGISAYMLIVWDYINYARQNGILVGPGRGSSAGALVAFLLKITNLDPIEHGLLFSRFINPDRPGLPDVDTDFDYLRRHEVIDYVTEKYGAEKVSQIGTFTTLSTKAAFKDIGRGLGIDHNIINDMNKLIPIEGGSPMSIEDSLENVPELQQYNEQFPELFELSAKVESLPRSSSVHPCGVVITSVPIHNVSPLMRSKEGDAVSQYEGGTLEELGLIKFDFLGLKNLSVIHIANELVKKRHDVHIDPDKIDIYDEKIYKVIHEGHTSALFQIESSGMQSLFKGLNKVDFPSLVAGIALYRPGPMQHIPEYQARANGQKEVEYFHADAEEVLKETHGIMIYQEQLMQLAGIFGGYTPGEQDNLRKATGKKSQAVMDKVLPELRQRTLDSGYAEETADELIRLIEPFVGYGLTRSPLRVIAIEEQCEPLIGGCVAKPC